MQDQHLGETLGNKTLDRRFVDSFGIFGYICTTVRVGNIALFQPTIYMLYLSDIPHPV